MSEWRIEGLGARGPQPDLRDELMLFGQFVGEWDIVERRLGEHNASHTERTGEVHFNWILDGRGVQDVWGPVDRPSGRFVPVGTTIRFYDARLGAWRSTWISPVQQKVRRFIGRRAGSEIVLKEENRGLRTEHWVFSDIGPRSFSWRALRRSSRGGPWRVVEEMTIVRKEGG